MIKSLNLYRWLYAVVLLAVCCFLGFRLSSGAWLQTDLPALLPQEQHWTTVQKAADQKQEQQLNRQFVALVGHSDQQTAFQTAKVISQQWRESKLFHHIESQNTPDIAKLQNEIISLSFVTLPKSIREQLLNAPQDYFQQYAEQIVDPFNHSNLLSLEQDWLGFGRFTLSQELLPNIQWDNETGMLYFKQDQTTWALLRAELAESNMLQTKISLLNLVEQNRQTAKQQSVEVLTASSALFAAYAKKDAETESTLMSSLGISLTLLLLLLTFRTLRVLWLFLPIVIGMLSGITATILLFGQIHILTLVVGTSLIGVLIDFPLHWLSSSLFNISWQAQKSMSQLRFTFFISLLVTLLGYALLGFTTLPVLQQTALFSAVALVAAIFATLLYLPLFFKSYQPRRRSNFLKNLHFPINKKLAWSFTTLFLIFIGVGIHKSKWQDDIRQWVAMPTELFQELQQISQITGIEFGSQYFLITAEDDQQLLYKSSEVSDKLTQFQTEGQIAKFQSLNQWIMSEGEQKAFVQQLATQVKPKDYAILAEIGLPLDPVENSLKNLVNQPLVNLSTALQTQIGQGWRSLYLGEIQPNTVATIIKVSGVKNAKQLSELANTKDIFWQDKRSHLNETFQHTRDQAAWLKVLSFLIAGILLLRVFGLKSTVKMLLIPFVAILGVVAIFGYLAMPIGLFTMFGLLLVSAISIDYTAYMQTAKESLADKRVAVTLAALTTMISFVLLGFSSTPAVATFGLSVSLGVALSLIITFKVFK